MSDTDHVLRVALEARENTVLAAFVPSIAAAGPKTASPEVRQAFAKAVLDKLGFACERGLSAEGAYESSRRVGDALWEVGHALEELICAVDEDPRAAEQCGLNTYQVYVIALLFMRSIEKKEANSFDREWWIDRAAGARPGRKKRAAVEVATMLATEYATHFGKLPGRSKKTADATTPFPRICEAVERILESAGYRISIGDAARSEAIRRASAQ
jgi:hypothetical protein